MIEPSIKSRPVYGTLTARPGVRHYFVADGFGAEAVLDLAMGAPAEFLGKTTIDYVTAGPDGVSLVARLATLRVDAFHTAPSIPALLPRLAQAFATARMGMRLYLAGTEGLIGQAMRIALEAGIDHAAIETEHRGSLARRVQCVHCKGITEDVRTQPVACIHCGLTLFVRDHYSRRLAAFQGVCIDAEEPGIVPTTEELFP